MPRTGGSVCDMARHRFQNLRYTITGEGKQDVQFVPKNHEERTVPLTTELGSLLADFKKHCRSERWIFTNQDGNPEGHFLKKFKTLARRAELNCGQCRKTIRTGRYDNRRVVDISCSDHSVCEQHYLHRLRKPAATNWLRSGFDLMKIKNLMGPRFFDPKSELVFGKI